MKRLISSNTKQLLLFTIVIVLAYNIWFYGFYANNGTRYYGEYMKNSAMLVVACPSKSDFKVHSWHYFSGAGNFESPLVLAKMVDYVFCDSISHKYFQLLFNKNSPSSEGIDDSIQSKKIVVLVNKNILNDPSYGSMNRPFPVFRYICTKNSLFQDSIFSVSDVPFTMEYFQPSEQESENNVVAYLSYVIVRKDFNKLFKR